MNIVYKYIQYTVHINHTSDVKYLLHNIYSDWNKLQTKITWELKLKKIYALGTMEKRLKMLYTII